ncbi:MULTISPECIES: nucleotidyltransferase family protein [unclassified Haloarcula]|uniref:nucleotidyltransferase family protein n=1 Tax=unclassified Haloarcula TaxID=2624677 RepID=UPI000EF20498|nr:MULTISPECIES: nucleotidyltransferase family protein [unclassified Haloarcula]RLM34486.1 nucleotidyltransferase family protein [Haloarcula sp. Atlit-120R]RLM43903.1 nucleotidyltransferase family protein [Haloarcula sp. Atlit-47R]
MNCQDHSGVGGVILAAGRSARYGPGNKLLATIDGTAVVRQVAETASQSSLTDVVAVLGYEDEAVAEALNGLSLSHRHNSDYAAGQSASVRHGVEFARSADWDAALFLLGDMPFVRVETIETLIETYRTGSASIVVPKYDGQRGNPVLFDGCHFDALASVSGDRGGRDVIEANEETAFIDVADPGIHWDIDTAADRAEFTDRRDGL